MTSHQHAIEAETGMSKVDLAEIERLRVSYASWCAATVQGGAKERDYAVAQARNVWADILTTIRAIASQARDEALEDAAKVADVSAEHYQTLISEDPPAASVAAITGWEIAADIRAMKRANSPSDIRAEAGTVEVDHG